VAYFGFVYRHSLEVLVGPVQSIAVTAAVLGGGGEGGELLFRWLPDDRTITEKTD
jgi:hypothetical protein